VDGDGPRRIQFFWSGNSSFDEARSRTYHAGSSGIHIIDKPLPLPLRTLRLRIDPGDSPGQLASLHLQLFNDPWHPFRKILSVTQIWIRLQIHRILGRLHRFHRYFRPNRAVTVLPDIIIPVYNGFEILGPCLETTLANSPVGCRILVFDDASPDPRIAPLLETFRQRGDRRLTIIRNECNLGFVGTVNRGMAMGRGDVILLNSDTEVPPNWAKRMVDCWATDPQGIGTVTAMSNNATICSFPGFCKDNELWPGASAIDIDSVFQTLPNRPVHLPTAVGFCMFISRACLDSVGIFDEATFGRGYGEENDFCVRAQRKGYASVAATNCFVYHKGSVSFAADSKPSLTRNIALLQAKWSFYNYLISQFITQDPMAKVRIQAAVTLAARWRPKGKPVVIHLVSAALTGGTIKHVEELAAAMSDRVCSFIIKISSTQISMTCTTASQYVTVDLQENHCKEFMQELTGACTPSIYHLHHLIHLHDDWLEAIRSSGVRYTFTVHDYYSACPSYTLVNAAGRYCQGERRWSTCQRCVMTNSLAVPRGINIHKWRHHWSEFLKHATAIIAPSQAAASILAGYYPILPITVIPHGSPPIADLVHSSVANSLSNGAGPLTIACLGALGPSKGSSIIHALAENIESRGLPLRIVVIGYTDRIREATVLHNGALTITGRYQPSDLAALITTHRPHVALLPSLWPETFSYTLSECWMAGLPVLASNLGAIGERIQNSGAGWLLPDLEQSTILNELLRLHQDHAAITLATQCAHTVSSRIVGMDAMVNSHLKSYALEASL
jgi:GT2 family glycosyltransferase/glycosyltransferase involved in cell wall biosynthesis